MPATEHGDQWRRLPPLSDDATVSVVIPARGAAEQLSGCLEAVLAQGRAVSEVVVAAADDTTADAARAAASDPRVRVVDNPSRGTSAGLNAAIAAARGDVLVRVDTHARIPAGYVARIIEEMNATGAANVGGRQRPVADRGFARGVATAMASGIGSGGATYRTGESATDADTVYLGAYRREALDEVGGFDEAFVRNQDAELNERLRANGLRVWFVPDLVVDYAPRSTVRSLALQYFEYGQWRRATVRRHGRVRVRQLAAPVVVVVLGVCAAASVLVASAWPLLVGAGGYAGIVLVGALAAARRPIVGLRTALALVTMHLTWGLGFLVGPPQQPPAPPPRPASPA